MPPFPPPSPQQVAQIQRASELMGQKKAAEAEGILRELLRRDPASVPGQFALAQLHAQTDRYDSALYMVDRLLARAPGALDMQFERASCLMGLGKKEEGVAAFTKLVEIQPGSYQFNFALGAALQVAGDLTRGVDYLNRAKQIGIASRNFSQVYEAGGLLVKALAEAGQFQDALSEVHELLAIVPQDVGVASTMAFLSNYLDHISAKECAETHKAVHDIYFGKKPKAPPPGTKKDPEKRLRVGFISPDLIDHSVSFFVAPLLRGLDRKQFEVFCYNSAAKGDAVTEALKKTSDRWRDVKMLNNGELAAQMRADEIDVAIDLAGLTRGTRVSALFGGAAPVQVTWCGYPNTTAIPGVQYRIVDSVTDPEWSDALHTEELIRLKGCFLCYDPRDLPDLAPLPPLPPDGPVIFTSFNAINKISTTTAMLWAGVLQQVPNSKLLLKNLPFKYESVRKRYTKMFEDFGAPAGSIEFAEFVKGRQEHLKIYGRTHIALDTAPYNGTTTSCEALVMGVPVVTLQLESRRDRHAARVTQSLLRTIGAPELIASSPDDYVRICRELAADRTKLTWYRENLRKMMMSSRLCDDKAFGQDFGEALRGLWARYCTWS